MYKKSEDSCDETRDTVVEGIGDESEMGVNSNAKVLSPNVHISETSEIRSPWPIQNIQKPQRFIG